MVKKMKIEIAMDLIKTDPDMSDALMKQLAQSLTPPIGMTTMYDAKKRVRVQIEKERIEAQKAKLNLPKEPQIKKKKPTVTKAKPPKIPESVIKGTDPGKKEIPKLPPKSQMDFFKFCRWFSYPSYRGLHEWQIENHNMLYEQEYSCTLVPREHGKSVLLCNQFQYALTYDNYDILYLGWTDQRKTVSLNVNIYATKMGLMAEGVNTRDHFRLNNGARFDSYLITSKDVLGMHAVGKEDRYEDLTEEDLAQLAEFEENLRQHILARAKETKAKHRKLWIAIDDPIDISFMHERHKEENLEMRFKSTLLSINPDKWSFTGTRKFKGDFFDFIDIVFGEDLIKYIRKPILDDGSVLCPERYTYPILETYVDDLAKGKKDIYEKRDRMGPYAYGSEWEQNPHPVTGEVWKTIPMIEHLYEFNRYDLIFISFDRATTTKETSDFTGITVIGRVNERISKERIDNPINHPKTKKLIRPYEVHVMEDRTRKITLNECLILADELYAKYKRIYSYARIKIAIEKQGGGDDFYSTAHDQHWNCAKGMSQRHLIHNTLNKTFRIKNTLKGPMTHIGKIYLYFPMKLLNSELYDETESFPNSAKVDGIDSLALGIEEISGYDIPDGGLSNLVEQLKKRRKEQNMTGQLQRMGVPQHIIQAEQRAVVPKHKERVNVQRRSMF